VIVAIVCPFFFLQTGFGQGDIFRHAVNAYRVSPKLPRNDVRCARAGERVKNPVARGRKELNEPFRQGFGECGRMVLVRAFGRKMEHVGRVRHVPANPVGNLLPESALDFGIVPPFVRLAQILEPGVSPVPHWDHDLILKHFEVARFAEMQTPLPRIPETVGPLARVTVALVPDVFLCPEPALIPQRQDQFQDVNMPLPPLRLFFDIEDKTARWFQNPQKLVTPGQKPFDIFFRFNPPVSFAPLVRVWRGCHDKVKHSALETLQGVEAVAAYNVRRDHKRIIAAKGRVRQFKTGFKPGAV
jgi:hypothetical protein